LGMPFLFDFCPLTLAPGSPRHATWCKSRWGCQSFLIFSPSRLLRVRHVMRHGANPVGDAISAFLPDQCRKGTIVTFARQQKTAFHDLEVGVCKHKILHLFLIFLRLNTARGIKQLTIDFQNPGE